MKIIDREYRNNEEDFWKIRNLLVESFKIKKSLFNWGVARWDIVRYKTRAKDYEAYDNVSFINKHHLWETENGRLIGAIITENNDNDIVIIIHPDFQELEDRMFDWAENSVKNNDYGDNKERTIKTCVYDSNKLRQNLLIKRGYKKHSESEYSRIFYLSKKIACVELPDGFKVRNVRLPKDYDNRIIVHQNAFGNFFDLEVFKMMQKAPSYSEKNDMIIEEPEGQFVSFCNFWIDEVNNFAEIEPFGTHSNYRNMGLGKALLTEVLIRLKNRNIDFVYIGSGPEPAVGNRLYESLGFTEKQIACWWIKDLK